MRRRRQRNLDVARVVKWTAAGLVARLDGGTDRRGGIGPGLGTEIGDGEIARGKRRLLDARERRFGGIERGHLAARNRARDSRGRHLWLGGHGNIRP